MNTWDQSPTKGSSYLFRKDFKDFQNLFSTETTSEKACYTC